MTSPTMICYLQPSELKVDHSIQPRERLNFETVDSYLEAIEATKDWPFPAIRVFEDEGGTLWLADGFHRIAALSKARQLAELANLTARAEVTSGTRRDAMLFAMEANLKHGLNLSHKERKASAIRLLDDPEWGKWSDRKLAKISGVAPNTVGSLRKLRSKEDGGEQQRLYERDGKTHIMNTSAIGQRTEGDDDAKNAAQPSAPMGTGLAGSDTTTATDAEIGDDSRSSHMIGTDEHSDDPSDTIVATTTATKALDRIRRADRKEPSPRRERDHYDTPPWAIEALLKRLDLTDQRVLEPCMGHGNIARALEAAGTACVVTGDINPDLSPQHIWDFSDADQVEAALGDERFDWIITNPPYRGASKFVAQARARSRSLAMLLNLGWMELADDRRDIWLYDPPNIELIMPRISFTDDGNTYPTTHVWYVWLGGQQYYGGGYSILTDHVTKAEAEMLGRPVRRRASQ